MMAIPDIFLVTGQVYPELEAVLPKYPRRGPRILFRNQGNGTFAQLDEEARARIWPRVTSAAVARLATSTTTAISTSSS